MRIRKSASRLLGSAYFVPPAPAPDAAHPFEPLTPPPMPFLAPCSAPESLAGGGFTSPDTASGETCELSRSPWDLIAELSLSDPQVEDDLVDKYFVSVTCRASWLFTASMPVASVKKEKQTVDAGTVDGDSTAGQPRKGVSKKAPKKLAVGKEKESEPKKAKVKQEDQEVKQPTYKCKKNDGKRWHCRRPVSHPNSLCDYHFFQKRAYLNSEFAALAAAETDVEVEAKVPQPFATSKPATSSKPRKKKPGHDLAATEGFYYYAGFGPLRSKRQCRSSCGMNESVPPKKEEEDEPAEAGSTANHQAPAAADGPDNKAASARDDASSCDDIAGIAGGDEESSDGDYTLGVSGRTTNGNGEHRDGKRKNGWKKRWRKPVKARSLKSLM